MMIQRTTVSAHLYLALTGKTAVSRMRNPSACAPARARVPPYCEAMRARLKGWADCTE